MIDWKKQILASWHLLNSMAHRRFGESPLAEEAVLVVMDQLLADDARRLQGYAGRSGPKAYIAAVSWRLLEDFSRKRFGRRRAPLWIRNLGGVWLKLYTLLCLERLDIMEAVAMIGQRQGKSSLDPEEVAWTIKQQVVDCGVHQGLEVEYDEELGQTTPYSRSPGEPEDQMEKRERRELFQMLFQTMIDASEGAVERTVDSLCNLKINLSSEERLLLQLCYRDNFAVSRAGEMLGLNRHQVNGRLRRLLARVRDEFERAGIDREILEMLR